MTSDDLEYPQNGASPPPPEPGDNTRSDDRGDRGAPWPGARRWRRLGRLLAVLFVVTSFVFWAWAFSPWARRENPARLDNRDYAVWAEARCAQAQAAIDALPTPRQANTHDERADQVDLGTAVVKRLVDDLRRTAEASLAVAPDSGNTGISDAGLVEKWIGDWQVYIADRENHSRRLQAADETTPDRELRFLLVDMTEGSTYTERMDGFARLNDMDSCQIPGDV